MATEWDGRDDWSRLENRLWSDAAENNFVNDGYAQALYEASFFEFGASSDQTTFLRRSFYDYMQREYGIEWDEVFDWDAWREAYGLA